VYVADITFGGWWPHDAVTNGSKKQHATSRKPPGLHSLATNGCIPTSPDDAPIDR
jgi:hypothetical protein